MSAVRCREVLLQATRDVAEPVEARARMQRDLLPWADPYIVSLIMELEPEIRAAARQDAGSVVERSLASTSA